MAKRKNYVKPEEPMLTCACCGYIWKAEGYMYLTCVAHDSDVRLNDYHGYSDPVYTLADCPNCGTIKRVKE